MVFASVLDAAPVTYGPRPFIASNEHALKAAALPIEVIIAPRGPTNRLATEIMTT